MDFMQMDLFAFAAEQAMQKPQSTQEKVVPVLQNFINDGRIPLPVATTRRITANRDASGSPSGVSTRKMVECLQKKIKPRSFVIFRVSGKKFTPFF